VAAGLSSKEIALETGLSHQTVDQYLSKAIAILGVSTRREAAREFQAYEQFKESEFKSPPVAEAGDRIMIRTSTTDEGRSAPGNAMHESAGCRYAAFDVATWRHLAPPIGGEPNDLTPAQRFHAILRIAIFSAIAMVAIVAVIAGAFSLFS
jgi:transcriptional regulator with XRE-family HTH domain